MSKDKCSRFGMETAQARLPSMSRDFQSYLSGEDISPPDVEEDWYHYQVYAERLIDRIREHNSVEQPSIPDDAFEDAQTLANLIKILEIITGSVGIDYSEIEREVRELREHITLNQVDVSLTTLGEEAFVRIESGNESVELTGQDVESFNTAIKKFKKTKEEREPKSTSIDFADDSEEMDVEDSSFSLSPNTGKFRIASTLAHQRNPATAEELEEMLQGTIWEKSQKSIGRTLGRLHSEGYVGRRRRKTNTRGQNPYEYQMTRVGKAAVEQAESRANKLGKTTWESVRLEETNS